jgi:hypothetical protein
LAGSSSKFEAVELLALQRTMKVKEFLVYNPTCAFGGGIAAY